MNKYGYIRVASGVPAVTVADCEKNTRSIISIMKQACEAKAEVLVLPELSVTGYTCCDLFNQDTLIQSAVKALNDLRVYSLECRDMLVVVGAPLSVRNKLFNCAVVIYNGKFIGVVPKTYLPNYNEFYEARWFASSVENLDKFIDIDSDHLNIPFSNDLVFCKGNAKIAIELCEDLWTPMPPSSFSTLRGANIILNLSASTEVCGKNDYLLDLIKLQSARTICAYIYTSAGYGESTTDQVCTGKAIICEDGNILEQSERFSIEPKLSIADVDVDMLVHNRMHTNTFVSFENIGKADFIKIESTGRDFNSLPILHKVNPHPFMPLSAKSIAERCDEIFNIQTLGLMRRLEFTKCHDLVIGISGGLDSTLALLIAIEAVDRLSKYDNAYSRDKIHAITMPGFGTSSQTHNNALDLMKEFGVDSREISIVEAVTQHFSDIGHDINVHDVTYENSQARERTQILMDIANQVNGLVIGTGDMSELALGWATYNGDHMSMYAVNSGVPKTVVSQLVEWYANKTENKFIKDTLLDIVGTPISPELIPPTEKGDIKQKTEDLVGPYELHDFFLYQFLKNGFTPKKIYFLATLAFKGHYSNVEIKKWITTFFRRFFSQQFKRSCMPDGPKVLPISLSPRGDLKMPSDASARVWIKECEEIDTEE